jgi:hypothetical protein
MARTKGWSQFCELLLAYATKGWSQFCELLLAYATKVKR